MWLLLLSLEPAQAQTIVPDKDGVVFVLKNRTGNGSWWTQATGELADALKAAKTNPAIKQIWVAEGVYRPLYSPADTGQYSTILDGETSTSLSYHVVVAVGCTHNSTTSTDLPLETVTPIQWET